MVAPDSLVIWVHLASALDKKPGAHRVITTAVQQASQMIEIQGAPFAGPPGDDDFRLTFATSMNGSEVQKTPRHDVSGMARAAADLAGSVATKSFSEVSTKSGSNAARGGGKLSIFPPQDDSSSEDASTAVASSVDLKGGSAGANNDAEAPMLQIALAANDSRETVSVLGSDLSRQTNASLEMGQPSTAAAVALAAPVTAPKQDGLGKLSPATATRDHKDEVFASNKEVATATQAATTWTFTGVQVILPECLETAAARSERQVPATASVSSQAGSRPRVSAAISPENDLKKSQSEIVNSSAKLASPDPETAVPSATAWLRQSDTGASTDIPDVNATGAVTQVDGESKIAVEREQSSANGVSKNALLSLVGAPPSDLVSGPFANALPHESKPLLQAPQSPSVSAVRGAPPVKTTVMPATTGVAVPKSPNVVQLAGSIAQLGEASTTAPSKIGGPVQASSVNVAGKLRGTGDQTTVVAVSAGRDLATAQVTSNAARPEISSRSPEAVTKDEKAKLASSEAEGTNASLTVDVPTVLGGGSGGTTSSPAASLNGIAGRVVAGGEASMPIPVSLPQAMSHANGSFPDTANAGTSSTVARTLSAVGIGTSPESAASSAPIAESHRMLLATPTALEVGVQSGTQGWLRIRAEVSEQGAVNASLAAGSSGGRELLHSQIPALNAFLHSEQMSVTTTVMDRGSLTGSGAAGSGGLGSQAGAGNSNGSLLQGGGAQSDGDQRESAQQVPSGSASDVGKSYNARSGVSETEGMPSSRVPAPWESGRWLNVRV